MKNRVTGLLCEHSAHTLCTTWLSSFKPTEMGSSLPHCEGLYWKNNFFFFLALTVPFAKSETEHSHHGSAEISHIKNFTVLLGSGWIWYFVAKGAGCQWKNYGTGGRVAGQSQGHVCVSYLGDCSTSC